MVWGNKLTTDGHRFTQMGTDRHGRHGLRGLEGLVGLKGLIRKILIGGIWILGTQLFGVDLNFQIGINAGILNGTLNEYLFASQDRYIISQLEWEQDNLFSLGLSTKFSLNSFNISNNTDYFFPQKSGNMHDSDWNEDGLKIIYSSSDNTFEYGFHTNFSFSYDFIPAKIIIISPDIQVDYSYFQFTTNNGLAWHGDKDRTDLPYDISWDAEGHKLYRVSGVDYYRHTVSFFAGINFLFNIFNDFQIETGIYVCPFSYISAMDHHRDDRINRDDGYSMQEIQYAYFDSYKFTLNFKYFINKQNTIQILNTFAFSNMTKGNTYTDLFFGRFVKIGQHSASDYFNYSLILNYSYSF